MRRSSRQLFLSATLIIITCGAFGQSSISADQPNAGQSASPVVISLSDAIKRAQQNEPSFASAVAEKGASALNRSIARSSLLPGVIAHNQFLYTQPNGVKNPAGQVGAPAPVRFIANNAPHEYTNQASVTETLGLLPIAQLKLADATAAQSAAALEIARRGLVVTVVGQYYGLLSADAKVKVAQRAMQEASRLANLTRQLEQGREVAHADVVKADLQAQQRQRDLEDAQLGADSARLGFGVLLFPDPRTPYVLEEEGKQVPPVPARADVEAAAQRNNPDLRNALESLHAADANVKVARAGFYPDLVLNYTYGIDSAQFAQYGLPVSDVGTDGSRTLLGTPQNLGYSASATLDIPVWDWFATRDRVKQGQLRRTAAKTALSFAQKHLVAQLDAYYREAEVAGRQRVSLEQSEQTAAESLQLTNLRYQAGEATVLEVVDAQNALSLAEQAYANGLVRYRGALANLQTLTGTLP
jgi:outer membrane protein TolC